MGLAAEASKHLESVIAQLPNGERRPGQIEMCEAVASAIESGQHLVVEAGTGVGKSLAYLLPAVLSQCRVVVATARKPLQDQLIGKDLPSLGLALGRDIDAAVLKGRSNYLCLAKLADSAGDGQGRLLPGDDARRLAVSRLARWADKSLTGDLGEVPFELPGATASLVTVSGRECPGAASCPQGDDCFAERALEHARRAALVVTNIDLYCLDMLTAGGIIGDHDVVIVDEAHELEAIAGRTIGFEVGPGRLVWLGAQMAGVLAGNSAEPAVLERSAVRLRTSLEEYSGRRLDRPQDQVAEALTAADRAVAAGLSVLAKVDPAADRHGRVKRIIQAASSLLTDIRAARNLPPGSVAWVPEGFDPVLKVAPVDVGPVLARLLFARHTAILTSATISVGGDPEPLARRVGLRPELFFDGAGEGEDGAPPKVSARASHRSLRVCSPFDYRSNAMLYCARHLPDPRRHADDFDVAAVEEITSLVHASGGRMLALFTSHRMLRLAARALKERVAWKIVVQEGPPRPGLVDAFRDDEQACLLATMGYWQGVDVPGRSLSLVVIDRLPFPRPDDPLLVARREAVAAAGGDPFEEIDVAAAATLLAQGAGRLIRTAADRGVVAVLDPRLATAGYRRLLLNSMPAMKRTVDGEEVRRFLRAVTGAG